jgi:SAM-dependent methyltransferase
MISGGRKMKFLEVGAGNGQISNLFLKMGMEGVGIDLNPSACANNSNLNSYFIENGSYSVLNQDFGQLVLDNDFDIFITSMVIEHIPEDELGDFIRKAYQSLKPDGTLCTLVPSSMKYWGIEDEIAGHIKRYEFEDFDELAQRFNMKVKHIAGLTYPLSNVLFGISNKLINRHESDVLSMDQKAKTVYTGNREVPYKTVFPKVLNIVLNSIVLYPFYLLSVFFKKNRNSMVIYSELIKK